MQCGPTWADRRDGDRCARLEDAEDYQAFEAAIIADYDVQSAVERELVLRLASLLWRLRRAMTMETGLFEIQADYLREFRHGGQMQTKSQELTYARFGRADSVDADPDRASHGITSGTEARPSSWLESVDPATHLARCFLRLANLTSYPLDRLSRYEAILWRQAGQIRLARCTGSSQTTKQTAPFTSRQPARGAALWERRVLTLEQCVD